MCALPIWNAFYREKTGLLADSETSSHAALHSNVYAMYFHLLPEADEEKILTFMKQKGFSCGVMLSYFVLRVFAERGQYDMVYELLVNEGEHGWVKGHAGHPENERCDELAVIQRDLHMKK